MGRIICHDASEREQHIVINTMASAFQVGSADITADDNFGTALAPKANMPEKVSRVGVAESRSKQGIDHMTLSKKWGISPEKAKRTVTRTTQHGVRIILHPSLLSGFRTNDRALRY